MTVNVGRATDDRQPPPRDVSAPTRRVVATIELLAADPAARPTLADIVRSTGMTRATAHAVLTQLCADGWIRRGADQRFSLDHGFAGRIAVVAGAPTRGRADEVVRTAAAETGTAVFLSERDGDHITVAAVAGELEWAAPGMRMPICAPLCREYIAWESSSDRGAWLRTVPSAARGEVTTLIDTVVDRGFSVENLGREATEVMATLHSVHRADSAPGVQRRVADLLIDLMNSDYRPESLTAGVPTVSIAVPIRSSPGPHHRVTASLVACPRAHVSPGEITAIVRALTTAATALEQAVSG